MPEDRQFLPEPITSSEIETVREIERHRSNVVVVCVDNDPESRMILRLVEKAGMAFIRSNQPLGAELDREGGIVDQVMTSQKGEVWVVEMPGPATENELTARGMTVRIIDHHTYEKLDRVTDPKTGVRNPSSLEQFLKAAEIDDKELRAWGYDPKTIRGLGIMDDRFVQGLRDAGYSREEINKVVDLRQEFSEQLNPDLKEVNEAAMEDWKCRKHVGSYLLVESTYPKEIRGAIATFMIYEDLDTHPIVISSMGGKMIYVQHIDPFLIERLKQKIPEATFTFGAGRCWGVNNTKRNHPITLEQVLDVLNEPIEPGSSPIF